MAAEDWEQPAVREPGPMPPAERIKRRFDRHKTQKPEKSAADKAANVTAWATAVVAFLTFVVVVVGAVQAWIFRNQLDEMKSSGEQVDKLIEANKKLAVAAEQSASAAATTAKLTEAIAQKQLRPYLTIEPPSFEIRESAIDFVVRVKNSGSTPAHLTCRWMAAFYAPDLATLVRTTPSTFNGSTQYVLAPGGAYGFWGRKEIPVDREKAVSELTNGSRRFYIIGRIDYRDTFGKRSFVKFKFRTVFNVHGALELAPADDGNEEGEVAKKEKCGS
jgi:hypothetical protein